MSYDPERHHRRSIRVKGYGYGRAGAYFVTVVAHYRACLFGEVTEGEMRPNDAGRIVQEEWTKTGVLRPRVTLDAFVVMPNHIHGIIILSDGRGTLQRAPMVGGGAVPSGGTSQRAPTVEQFGKPTSDSVPTIIRLFKSATTKRINAGRGLPGVPVWQRNYYEHIIRGEASLGRIRRYIAENPARWASDRENPAAIGPEATEPWLS